MGYCGENCLHDYGAEIKQAVTLRCRSWGCQDCAPQRRRELIAQVLDGKPTTLLTLTSRRRADKTPTQAARELVAAWRKIRRSALQTNKLKTLEFLAIFERTRLGWPHLHIAIRGGYLSQAWISCMMADLTDSPVVDIRRIDNPGRAAAYVAKYTSKEAAKFDTLKRYWSSKAYRQTPKPEKIRTHGWDRDRMSLERWLDLWCKEGWIIVSRTRWRASIRSPDCPDKREAPT